MIIFIKFINNTEFNYLYIEQYEDRGNFMFILWVNLKNHFLLL